jgi:uncharacterized repeat protein (TIGR01451 family)
MSRIKDLRNIFSHVPKKLAALFGALAVVLIPATILAWGPADRPTYTIEKPASQVTFNSITNNPNYGDERNFTSAKLSSEGSSAWRDEINVTSNSEYSVNIYVHNNAAANLNLVATNTRAQATWPTGEANQLELNGLISADNATPRQVWDQVVFKNESKKFKLVYVSGSARYYNNANPSNGFAISDDVVKAGGALLGYQSMDGKIPGCFQYSGVLNIKVRSVMEVDNSFTMEKKVRLHGDTAWSKSVTAKPGQEVDYQISYKNTGSLIQEAVTVRDELPAKVSYKTNTTTLRNGTYSQGDGMTLTSNNIVSTGVNIGSYIPAAAAYVRFTATMPSESQLDCGVNRFVNKGFVKTSATKDDTAEVVINKDCPQPTPVYTCNALAINKVTRTKFDLTNTYTAQDGAIYRDTTYEVTDPDGNKTTKTLSGTYTYENTKVGKYTVVATANFDVDGQTKSVSSTGCQGEFEVTAEPIVPVYTCNALAINKVTRTKFDLTNTYTAQDGAIYKDTTYEVTDPDGNKTTKTLSGTYTYENTKVGKYTVVATTNFTVDGQTKSVSSTGCKGEFTVEAPAPTPEYVCNVLNINKTSRTTFQFTTDYTVKDTTYLNVTYTITGPSVNETKVSTASDGGLYHNQTTPGTYSVVATLKTDAGDNTSAGCKQTFVVEPEVVPAEAVCKILTANQTAIKRGESVNFRVYPEYSGNVVVNSTWMDFGDGEKTQPLNVVNYTHTYAVAGNYTAQAYVNFTVEGAARDNVTSANCQLPIQVTADEVDKCTVPGKEDLDKDDPNCKPDSPDDKCTVPGKEDLDKNDPNCKPDTDDKCTVPGKEDLDKNDPNCKPDAEMCDIPGYENLPKNDPRCKRPEDKCKVPGKEYLPANDPKCVSDRIDHCKIPGKEALPANDPKCVSDTAVVNNTTPTSPTTLPATGAEVFGIVGLGSLVTSAGYYITSRRRLSQL